MTKIPAPIEEKALAAALPNVGAYVAGIGMDKPLSAYSKEEIIGLVRVSAFSFRDQLLYHTLEDAPF